MVIERAPTGRMPRPAFRTLAGQQRSIQFSDIWGPLTFCAFVEAGPREPGVLFCIQYLSVASRESPAIVPAGAPGPVLCPRQVNRPVCGP